jgi:MFS family permease
VWLLAAGFLVAADARLVGPLLPAIADDLGGSIGTAGLTVSGYLASYAVCQLLYGPFGDRVGPIGSSGYRSRSSPLPPPSRRWRRRSARSSRCAY